MHCVIAAEPGATEVILDNLQKRYPDWRFETASDADRLFQYSDERPDVMLVSRFLPGDPASILRRLSVEYPASHIVLLAGVINEQTKAYIRQAKMSGLTNVVTGKLPGCDRPYTIIAALTQARKELLEVEGDWEEEEPSEADSGSRDAPAVGYPARVIKDINIEDDNDRDMLTDCCTKQEKKQGPVRQRFYTPSRRPDGKFALVAANKGGVGKTTAAIALSLALSRNGVPVCLADFDFGGPNVAVFFDIKNKSGIEKLAGKKHMERFVKDLLVNVEDNLMVLPGPTDKTLPYFEPGQLAEIVDILARDYMVVGDTPPEFWTKPWLDSLFHRADLVLAVVDQSKFSEAETKDYAPKLIMMGAEPSRIRIVCNRFNAKLHSVKKVEQFFNAGIKASNDIPRVITAVPEAWEDFVKKGYRGEVAGLNDPHSPWLKLAGEVAKELGLPFITHGGKQKMKSLFSLFRKG